MEKKITILAIAFAIVAFTQDPEVDG